jgi:nucleoside-triphosphatase THEP1
VNLFFSHYVQKENQRKISKISVIGGLEFIILEIEKAPHSTMTCEAFFLKTVHEDSLSQILQSVKI